MSKPISESKSPIYSTCTVCSGLSAMIILYLLILNCNEFLSKYVYLILGSSDCIEKSPFCCMCKIHGGCCLNANGTDRDTKKCSQPICNDIKATESGTLGPRIVRFLGLGKSRINK